MNPSVSRSFREPERKPGRPEMCLRENKRGIYCDIISVDNAMLIGQQYRD